MNGVFSLKGFENQIQKLDHTQHDQDHDGISDELEYGDSFDDDPFADFN